MLNLFNRILMVLTLLITGISSIPLNRLPAQDTPPGPEATEVVNDDTIIFLPMSLRSPWVSPPTPTPPAPTTPAPTTPAPVTPTPVTPTPPTPTLPPVGNAIIVDHTSLPLFDQIPEQYLTAARNLHMYFSDRSVGLNIYESLSCLAASSWASSSSDCRKDFNFATPDEFDRKTYNQTDWNNGTVPELIQFTPDSNRYNFSNWEYEFEHGSYWYEITRDFFTVKIPAKLPTNDVLSHQFSYLAVNTGSLIAHPTRGYFADTSYYDIHEMEDLIADNPDKVFFLWTSSLARNIGTQESTAFNHAMRLYAIEHGMILFDAADILSHDRNGQPCFDNRDGVEFRGTDGSENYPDDGIALPAICNDYTTEYDNGHLGMGGGRVTMAKAFWILMARIAGWNP